MTGSTRLKRRGTVRASILVSTWREGACSWPSPSGARGGSVEDERGSTAMSTVLARDRSTGHRQWTPVPRDVISGVFDRRPPFFAALKPRCAASRRPDRDVAPPGKLGEVCDRPQLPHEQDGSQHDLHLEQRKARAEAPTPPAAEGNPLVCPGLANLSLLVKPALGAKRV